jgi:rhamnosyltransferase
VLVLLAACNGARWIREQMESILAQEGVDLAIALRDDVSTDSTRWELARFEADERIRITVAASRSGSAGQNVLSLIRDNAAAPFDFVAFADQDDLWHADKLLRGCRMLAATPGAAGYSSATLAAWDDGRELLSAPAGTPTDSDFLFEGAGQGCTFVLTAAFYERLRRFVMTHPEVTNGIHYHDWMVYALARSWGLQWCFDMRPSMRYRQHAGNDTGARGTLKGVVRRFARIRDGWYGAQLRAIAAVCRAAAPDNGTVVAWHRHLTQAAGLRRRVTIAQFCASGGRRRTRDNMMTVLAAFCGWI